MKIREWFKKNFIYLGVFTILSLILVLVIFPICSYDHPNYDSAYQYCLTKHSLSKIWELIPYDYSPPLYALLLKGFCAIFGYSLYIMRIFSLFSIIGMMWLVLFPGRRIFGEKIAVVASVMIITSNYLFYILPEIRPTVLAMFFMLGVVIYAADICFNGTIKAYVLFNIFVVLSMYTHNISMIACIAIFVMIFGYFMIKKNYKNIKKLVISGIVCSLAYLPWLSVVLKQFSNVKDNYWVSYYSPKDAFNWMYVLSLAKETEFGNILVKAIGLIIIFVVLDLIVEIINSIKIKKRESRKLVLLNTLKAYKQKYIEKDSKVLFLIIMSFSMLLMPIIFHYTLYPLLTQRYIYIFVGVTIMALAASVTLIKKRWIIPVFMIALLCNGQYNYYDLSKMVDKCDVHKMIEEIKEDSKDKELEFLHLHEYTFGIMSYYFPKAKHYIADETFTVLRNLEVISSNVVEIGKLENIRNYTNEYYMVFESDMYDEHIIKNRNNEAFERIDKDIQKKLKTFPYDKKYNLIYMCPDYMSYVKIKYDDK